nr:40S ribosomal protein S3-3-like [Tanacetum cinerariifolium]
HPIVTIPLLPDFGGVTMATQLSKKQKFVADGVFFVELNVVLMRELAEDGYSIVEVRVTPMRTEIIIRATRTHNVLGNYLITVVEECFIKLKEHVMQDKAYVWTVDELEYTAKALGYAVVK